MIGRRKPVFLGFVLVTVCLVQRGLMSRAKVRSRRSLGAKRIMKLQIVWRNPHPPSTDKTLGQGNCCRCVWSSIRGS